MLAPLTNLQSEPDGRVSEDELRWLAMRARGGFGLVNTCAAYVAPNGRGFPRQLGIAGDHHLEGLRRLADAIRAEGALASVQLYHAGYRASDELASERVSASHHPESGARALSTGEVKDVITAFVEAAYRAESAGFDGVQLHGAHAFLLDQFLAARFNSRDDCYGGSEENRSRIYFDIIDGIRERCSRDFQIGVRVSPERLGMSLDENLRFYQRLMDDGAIDYLDLSMGDALRESRDEKFRGRTLLSHITVLDRGEVRLGVAGQIVTAGQCREVLDSGVDYVTIGTGAILHHDFPEKVRRSSGFTSASLPVTRDHLEREGVGHRFVEYLATWPNLVAQNGSPQ